MVLACFALFSRKIISQSPLQHKRKAVMRKRKIANPPNIPATKGKERKENY